MDKNNLYNRPFIIRLINPYNYYKEKMSKSDAFEYVDRILLLGIIKQIIAVSEKVKNDVNQSLEIYKGPIQGGATFEPMQYYPVMIEDICEEKEFINEITENLNVDFLELPAYMKLKISYKKKNITYKIGKLQLNINLSFGNGGNLNHSQWKRSFNCARSKVNYCGMSVLFELIIKRRRINIVKIFRKNKIWKDEEYLKYLVFMAEKLGDEIDWLEDDVDIEEKNRFILLEDNPPKYRYAMGAIPPGNGCVVYDLN